METRLYVGNLSYQTTSEDLSTGFAAYGTVIDAKVIEEKDQNGNVRSKGFGFVTMSTKEEADAAIAGLDGQDFMNQGRQIKVNEARPKEDRPRNNFGGGNGNGGGYNRSNSYR